MWDRDAMALQGEDFLSKKLKGCPCFCSLYGLEVSPNSRHDQDGDLDKADYHILQWQGLVKEPSAVRILRGTVRSTQFNIQCLNSKISWSSKQLPESLLVHQNHDLVPILVRLPFNSWWVRRHTRCSVNMFFICIRSPVDVCNMRLV